MHILGLNLGPECPALAELCRRLRASREERKYRIDAFFYDNHYRRFLVLDELTEALRQAGFRIEYAREQTGFAPYGNDDPPVIRVVAVKN